MGYYTVDHSGSTHINEGSKDEPKLKKVKYEEGVPVEDVKKGDLDHVGGAEYHTGEPKKDSDKKTEDSKKK